MGPKPGGNLAERRVLMICGAFPPSGGAGVQRSAKFAKYLPQYGWKPIVWSCGPLADLPRDDSLLRDLPDDLSLRMRPFGDAGAWAVTAGRLTECLLGAVGVNGAVLRGVRWRVDRVARGVVSRLVPDAQVLWALASLGELRRVIARERVDAIYSTFSPASNHLLGWLLKSATRRPWVSDYRDLWTEDCWYPFSSGPRWRRAADRYLERRFLEDADAVIGVSVPQTRILADRVPTREGKFRTIPNGFDSDDFDRARRSADMVSRDGTDTRAKRFVLAHVGRFSRERVRPEMIEGFARFARGLGDDRHRFELRLVGWTSAGLGSQLDVEGVRCTARGYVPHDQAVAEMLAADALLLQYPDEPNADTAISGKLFEYFAAGKPVLMIGPRSSVTRQLVESLNAGIGANPNAEAICAALQGLWRRWRAGTLQSNCDPDRLRRYTRRSLAGELADVLESVTPQRRCKNAARQAQAVTQ